MSGQHGSSERRGGADSPGNEPEVVFVGRIIGGGPPPPQVDGQDDNVTRLPPRTSLDPDTMGDLAALLTSIASGGTPLGPLELPPRSLQGRQRGARQAEAPALVASAGAQEVTRLTPAVPHPASAERWPDGPNLGDDALGSDEIEDLVHALVSDATILRDPVRPGLTPLRLCVAAHRAGFEANRIGRFANHLAVWFGLAGVTAACREAQRGEWSGPRPMVTNEPDVIRRLLLRRMPPTIQQVDAACRAGLDAAGD